MGAEAVDLTAWWAVRLTKAAAAEPAPPPGSPITADDDDEAPPDVLSASSSQTHTEASRGFQQRELQQEQQPPQMPPRGPHIRQRPVRLPCVPSDPYSGGTSPDEQEDKAAERGRPLHVESRELSELPARASSGDWPGALP